MEQKLKFAIIGCGRIAQRHAEHISNTGTLVAVCDVVEGKANELASKYGAKAHTSVARMLESHPE